MSEPTRPASVADENLPYVKRRLEPQAAWHSGKAVWNKRRYYTAEIATLVSGALIPIINTWIIDDPWDAKVLSAILGGIIVIAAGIAKLLKFQENWLQFRAIAEALNRERELYIGKVGDYAIADDKREALLVERVEALIANTTTQFIAAHRAAPAPAGGKPADPGQK